MDKEYFFEDINVLVRHLFSIKPDLSPIKLQKALYFLFAYYGASYGSVGEESEGRSLSEISNIYPKYLFKDDIVAWKYGPVVEKVYRVNRDIGYTPRAISKDEKDPDVIMYIEEIFSKINSISDFALVERSHMDKTWRAAYETGLGQGLMMKEDIVNEYKAGY